MIAANRNLGFEPDEVSTSSSDEEESDVEPVFRNADEENSEGRTDSEDMESSDRERIVTETIMIVNLSNPISLERQD